VKFRDAVQQSGITSHCFLFLLLGALEVFELYSTLLTFQ